MGLPVSAVGLSPARLDRAQCGKTLHLYYSVQISDGLVSEAAVFITCQKEGEKKNSGWMQKRGAN